MMTSSLYQKGRTIFSESITVKFGIQEHFSLSIRHITYKDGKTGYRLGNADVINSQTKLKMHIQLPDSNSTNGHSEIWYFGVFHVAYEL